MDSSTRTRFASSVILKIFSGLFQSIPLRIRSGQLFIEPDVTLRNFLEDGSKLHTRNLLSHCLSTRIT